jgi:hypothetical protein
LRVKKIPTRGHGTAENMIKRAIDHAKGLENMIAEN